MPRVKRIGVLTGGGDAPGLNAVIRAVVKASANSGIECIGLEDSFDGLIEPGRSADFVFLDRAQHSSGKDLLDSVRKGDLPGIGMVMIDGVVRVGRSRNTPPADRVPEIVH